MLVHFIRYPPFKLLADNDKLDKSICPKHRLDRASILQLVNTQF